MSYVTYSPNEIVYVRDIGYATLLNCGARNTISQKVDAPPTKKQSIYFDPDLFNSDGDSNHSKKSKSDDEKIEKKHIEVIKEKSADQETNLIAATKVEQKQQAEVINIVQARLEGGTGMVYTYEKNITKSIFLVVKSFLVTKKEQIIVEIQIGKTIDTLKKQIFTQIGEQISHYYNIKLFALNPAMTELNVPSKTISQCLIKDNAKVILTADYAFTFRPITQPKNSKYKITLTNNTIVSSKIVEQPKKVEDKAPIPLPPPPPQIASESGQNKVQQMKAEQKKQEPKISESKKQANVQVAEEQKVQSGPYSAKCTVDFTSGVRYWEIKVEKLPVDEQDLVIGVCVESTQKDAPGYWYCEYAWAYQIITGKKVFVERSEQTNVYEQEIEPYGYVIRQNDTIGVLLQYKGKKASLTFYKNSISCGEAFSIDLKHLRERRQLVPFVNVGGECQVTLESKAVAPVDSYRWK